MAKSGLLKFLAPAALGIGALATGGFGLPGLLGGLGGEAAGAGADIGAAAGEAAAGAGEAAAAAPLTAGSEFLIPGTDTALTTGAAGIGGAPIVPEFTGGFAAGEGSAAPVTGGLLGAGDLLNQTGGVANVLATGGETAPAGGPLAGINAGTTAGVGATPTAPVAAAGPPGGLPSAVAAADLPSGATLATDEAGNVIGSDFSGGAEGGGGIFGAGVTGGDVFKELGGLRGLTGLLSAGIMGSQLLKGVRQYPEQQTLGQQAAGYTATGNALQQPLFTGALPTGAESAVDLATAASKARISNAYAGMGLSGSTMESEALNQADRQAAAQKFGIADQLLQQAQGYSQLGTQTTQDLLRTSMTEDQQYRESLANFAKALAGTGAGIGSTTSPTYTLTPTA